MRTFDGCIITFVSIFLSAICPSRCFIQNNAAESPSNASAFSTHAFEAVKLKRNCFDNGMCFLDSVSDLKVCLPGSQTVLANEYHSFKCQFNSNTSDVHILFNNNKHLPSGVQLRRGLCEIEVIFHRLGDCHNGVFSCVVSNVETNQPIKKLLKMHVVGQSLNIPIISSSKDRLFILNTTAYFKCSFYANLGIDYVLEWKNPLGVVTKIVNGTDNFRISHYVKGLSYDVIVQIKNITQAHGTSYYCSIASKDKCNMRKQQVDFTAVSCPAGSYCQHDSMYSIPCYEGTYNPSEGQFTKESCRKCPVGSYCPPGSIKPMLCEHVTYRPIENHMLLETEDQSPKSHKASLFAVAKKKSDCERCPLSVSCKNDNSCVFLCNKQPKKMMAFEGQTISLNCRISDKKLLNSLYWLKDGKALHNDSHYAIAMYAKYSQLTIKHGSRYYSGDYSCFGTENYMGTNFSVRYSVKFQDPKAHRQKNGQQKKMFFLTSGLGTLAVVVILSILLARYFICKLPRRIFGKRDSMKGSIINDAIVEELEVQGIENRSCLQEIVTRNPCFTKEDIYYYDVFICYSSLDRPWVKDTLLKQLDALKIKTCIDFRDFAIGETIIQNISDAIRFSKKTIAILSPDFLQSEFCKHELQSALRRKNEYEIIPILYKKCDVPELLKHKTYLDWDHCDVKPYFWNQLLDAINWEPSKSTKQNYV